MHDDEVIEMEPGENEGRETFEFRRSQARIQNPLMGKLIVWGAIIGSVVVGTILFLFFLTLFIYFFIPILLVTLVWSIFQRWRVRG